MNNKRLDHGSGKIQITSANGNKFWTTIALGIKICIGRHVGAQNLTFRTKALLCSSRGSVNITIDRLTRWESKCPPEVKNSLRIFYEQLLRPAFISRRDHIY